ncbi:MAG: 4Fe-4S binding protein [Ruminococcaceae bacterium]|jgi:epoxyqueuosine reductase QueG|nr:4Fe-4S binding protein [Oscillospiraceae bacterium]
MLQFKEEIRQAAKTALVDMIGFAGRDRFDGLSAEKNPFSLFPAAQTVIMIARRVTRGSLRGVEEGINFGDYGSFGKSWLADEFLAQSAYELVTFIERSGYEAMPLVPEKQVSVSGVARTVQPDFNYAAVACGLGEIGLSGEILTPRFGPRQRFIMILTEASLPADPLLDQPVCTRCGRCVSICPLQALDMEKAYNISICGKTMQVAARDEQQCAICKNGAVNGPNGVDRLAALCNRTCVDELEQAGVLSNTFEARFRKRQAWGKNEFGEAVEIVEGGRQ